MFQLFNKKSRAERNERKYRKWLRSYTPSTTNTKIELVRVFTDRNDRNYYVAKDIGTITKERTERIEQTMVDIDWSVPKSEITDRMSEIMETIKNAPYSNYNPNKLRTFVETATNQIGDLLYRMKSIRVDDLLIESALYFFYVDNENPYIIDADIQAEKLDAVRNDPELRAFFLATIEQVLTVSANGKNGRSRV
jgi:hypothetical protein